MWVASLSRWSSEAQPAYTPGFEVAGIVIETLPIVVSAVEAYVSFMPDWGKTASELKSINQQLTMERSKLYNVCEQLLGDVVPQADVEPMLQDPFGPLWQAKEPNDRIRRRLYDSYDPFEQTVLAVREALETVIQRLSVQITRDGKVEWVDRQWMPREFKKFLDLEGLTRQSVTLEPVRRRRSRVKVVKILRDLSSSIYCALRSSIVCTDPHDEKGHIRLFVKSETILLFRSPGKLPTTDITFTKIPPPTLGLCAALKEAREARPVRYGCLADRERTEHHFEVYPLGATADSDRWSIVTLQDVLERRPETGLQSLVWLEEKVRLALAVASAVLQLSKTPWLPGTLTSKSVHFFNRGSPVSYQHPFLSRSFPHVPTQPRTNTTLFALEILLLEIILGAALDQLREPQDDLAGLLEQRVALISPPYKTVVERCIGCSTTQDLSEEQFRQKVYEGVVIKELAAILEHAKL
ncbi:hypothetical protein B0T26DRAFT_737564 [Lasiosphaeria miniovina]|uniref:DUF7580 domain-containing protein n=1 Tax=Lasiosphaeria miniovina TaxID=1954250 RepID=A0AA40EGV4_9PEZI|nr:uncharacterized protein B0T26DRAFT_737564 [Lasiosphaeria miniovina]KAK0735123.1 hypothetical protein B0T26DRAFT_737564 [Lasiosphaeria miniovina]